MLPIALPARHFGVLLLESLVVNLPEQPFSSSSQSASIFRTSPLCGFYFSPIFIGLLDIAICIFFKYLFEFLAELQNETTVDYLPRINLYGKQYSE